MRLVYLFLLVSGSVFAEEDDKRDSVGTVDWNRPRDDLLMVRMSLDSYTGVTGVIKINFQDKKV